MSMALGAEIVAARQAAGMTQEQLAAATGIAQPNISAIERGRYKPESITIIIRIATALGRSVLCDGRDVRLLPPEQITIRRS